MSTSHVVWAGDVFSFPKECLWGSKKFAVDFVPALQNWERFRNRDFILDLHPMLWQRRDICDSAGYYLQH